ncbi:MAG: YdcF family protein [Burkholderiaceae bacterium]|jgi:uncharacterized SAM-binding protein YcdF (DUF218 family)
MTLSSLLTSLVIPLNLSVALLILAVILFVLRLRRSAAAVTLAAIVWVVFWSLPASTLWAGGGLEQRYPHQPAEQVNAAQAIVVLGGITAGGKHNWFEPHDADLAVQRVDTAAELFKAGRAPYIVVSGAALEGNVSEAQIMANALRQQGVPNEAIIMENQSLTTHENALYTARLLEKLGFRNIILVTSSLHMPRAMAVFMKQGIQPQAAPSPPQIVVPSDPRFSFWQPNLQVLDASRSIIKEYVGMLVYWLRGWT